MFNLTRDGGVHAIICEANSWVKSKILKYVAPKSYSGVQIVHLTVVFTEYVTIAP